MLDRWWELKACQIASGKSDMGDVCRVIQACNVAHAVEAYLAETFDEMAELVARNAVNNATALGLTHVQRILN